MTEADRAAILAAIRRLEAEEAITVHTPAGPVPCRDLGLARKVRAALGGMIERRLVEVAP